MSALILHRTGPGNSVQDLGRPGFLAFGVSRGGAADTLALAEGAALLGQPVNTAALELVAPLEAEATADLRIALTGAPMRALLDGKPLAWNAVHALPRGARLALSPSGTGVYGYLHVGGGIDTPPVMGSRSAHLAAGLGRALEPGDRLPTGPDSRPDAVNLCLPAEPRFDGGTLRVVAGPQTAFFAEAEIARFQTTAFRKDARANRMGARLAPDGAGFHSEAGLSVISEVITPGDIQVPGDGAPFVLLAECQTTGGYPRLGTVLPADLPRVVQASPGAILRFRLIDLDEALDATRKEARRRAGLRSLLRPLVRDPADIRDLLRYQLIGGVTAGDDLERP
ncbi:MAG: biotin-dependent carboxyltransferase family protein [Pararhodobacter sp.]